MGRVLGLTLAALVSGTIAFFALGLFSPVATAIPAFGRKTGMACSACHEVWPRLNDFGQNFRDRGYRLKRDRDAPVAQDPSYWPLSLRTTAGYQFLRQALVQSDSGPITTNTGTFGFTGLDVWAAGTLGDKLSFAITYTPGLESAGFQLAGNGANGDLETAFIGLHDLVIPNWVNLRVGKHALDLPIDEHRQITLTSGYNSYHFHPEDSSVAFEPGSNHAGVELYGHSELSRVRYSISLVNERGSQIFSNNLVSNPVVWGHLTASQYLDNGVLAAVKGGVFGAIGWHPTGVATLTPPPGDDGKPGGPPMPLQGSGYAHQKHSTYGAEGHLVFFSTVNPLTLTGVLWGNTQDQAFGGPSATQQARWLGAFIEGVYTYNPRLSLVARYERIRTLQAFDPTRDRAVGELTSMTGAVRHTFELTSRTEAALQVEVTRTSDRAPDGSLPSTWAGLLAFDFTM